MAEKKIYFVLGLCLFSLLLTPILSVAQEDLAGSKDHPLLTRMPNFYISDYEYKEFGKADFKDEEGEGIKVEGHIYDIYYQIKEEKKAPGKLQVLRNYENAIKEIGGSTVYEAKNEAWLKVEKDGKITWIYVDARTGGEYALKIVEKKAMVQEVVADAKSLARDISSTGHASVYGIHFDFNKATVKPESEPTLKEISKLLKQNSKLNLYVVGHTDNVGKITYNMQLSLERAKAVVKALGTKYGVAQGRLDPYGVGPLVPVASNETEEGRALNRRVELVKK
ncbi:MAG: OmpA family protein [Candidatus Aminicenantes bacterium]|nr:OmpA family protein [Candidatus Aminicenantes bacterium]